MPPSAISFSQTPRYYAIQNKTNNQTMTTLDESIPKEDFEDISLDDAVTTVLTPQDSMGSAGRGRRLSRASLQWFQNETAVEVTDSLPMNLVRQTSARRRQSGLIDRDGKLRDDFIVRRQSINNPTKGKLNKIPLLADLTTEITSVDGWVLTQLFLSGFAKMSTKIDELNKINVFPIADGDTGANMKVCLKLPTRNLLLDPSDSILTVSSNMAADVLLNGQGNSGTILSHFFVSLAEELKELAKDELNIAEFAGVLARTGVKMTDAVPNPVEGTLLSVTRDACQQLDKTGATFQTLSELLDQWNTLTQEELRRTPERLIVDGVKVLEAAGVVDSGAQGFAYCVEGMYLASQGRLPEASDPNLFKPSKVDTGDEAPLDVDHTVTDSKFQYCTECVVLLKDGVTKKDVLASISDDEELGDSVACVSAPAKEGGDMCKIHIHSNNPESFFDRMRPFSRESTLKKEKVEDMWCMRANTHEDTSQFDLSDAKFTIMGLCDMILPPTARAEENFTLPVFMVPSTTQEPIDVRFATDSETCNALNCQRHKRTAIKYTTAASNPMQIKIELLAALSRGLPILVFLMSKDKRISALGRNVIAAVSMLTKEQQEMVKVLVHGWGFYESPFLMEAMAMAQAGKTIDEAYKACQELSDRNFVFASFVSSPTVKKLLAWRPGLFPSGFTVEDGQHFAFGLDPVVREGEPLNEFQKAGMLMKVKNEAKSLEELEDLEVERIKTHLLPGQKIGGLLVPCVGRPDLGHRFVGKLRAAGIPLADEPIIYNTGFFSVATSSWGEMLILYKIVR